LKTLYLAGPINGCSDSEANDWRSEVKEKLGGLYEFMDPMRRDYRGRELEPGIALKIVTGDMKDIEASDVILAMCPKPSVGTSMEVFWAFYDLKKTVVAIAPTPASPWLLTFSTVQYTNLLAAITYLRTIAKGKSGVRA
jgi:nucleoside 2-deoxyribosyltransferase